jgi:very-short-patch-repair endonuclease
MLYSPRNIATEKAKRITLRKNSTPAEKVLWSCLRARRCGGYKFYRQYSIGKFVVDFYCHERRLVIELDGNQHKGKHEKDLERSIWIENQHIKVIRFWNSDIIGHTQEVLDVILDTLKQ